MEPTDEDSIDAEALQAQIDISMGFAQTLVSSWMKGRKLPESSRKKDLEKELSEHMKRPPRLGVGAPLPDGYQNVSREVARLKGKLNGSGKRLPEREEDEPVSSEEESRAAAIKKNKKKRKTDASEQQQKSPQNSVGSSSTGQHKVTKHEPPTLNEHSSAPQHAPRKENPSTFMKTDHPKRAVTSPATAESGHKSDQNPIVSELFKLPLLNLTTTGSDDDKSHTADTIGSPSTSPKKKRKRRKKKKPHPLVDHPPSGGGDC